MDAGSERTLVTGASGFIGRHVALEMGARGPVVGAALAHPDFSTGALPPRFEAARLDLADPAAIETLLDKTRPSRIVHLGAMSSQVECERDPARAEAVNVGGTAALATWAGRRGAGFFFFSTDLVFDGRRGGYREEDAPHPLSVYGRTKARAEEAARRAHPGAVVARVALAYGPTLGARESHSDWIVRTLRKGESITLFTDETRAPVAALDVARAVGLLLERGFAGTIHLAGPSALSRHAFGLEVARAYGLDAGLIRPASRVGQVPERQRDGSLVSSRATQLLGASFFRTPDDGLRQAALAARKS
ncbi:MAG: SDR family oxidoreductase [Planctomycetes bacterium]|nr:SDR family oxidoreductase [Planctomycetota bacterium]